jgi:hypothetical protein
MARTARTAATFCVFLTLWTTVFLATAVFRAAALGAALAAGFFALAGAGFAFAFAFAVTFLPAVTFLLAGLTDVARLAFGKEEVALATRFAVFAARFAVGRADDRRRPFVRLLLMSGISKRLLTVASSRRMRGA